MMRDRRDLDAGRSLSGIDADDREALVSAIPRLRDMAAIPYAKRLETLKAEVGEQGRSRGSHRWT